METVDVRVLREARAWLAEGHRLLLATVVKTWDSSPRPVGSVLEFQPDSETLDAVVRRLESGQLVQRTVDVATGAVTLAPASTPAAVQFDGATLCSTLGPQYRMLLIGAGALAEYLATMALFNDFAVTVCDPRGEHVDSWSVPGVHITREMPDDAVLALAPDTRTCIVALSHDPKLDDLALLEALHSLAFYVGAIGSRRNTGIRRQRFMEHFGETTTSLERLHAPVGSRTPAEIAVSIMAEILAVKNGVVSPAAIDGSCRVLPAAHCPAVMTQPLTP